MADVVNAQPGAGAGANACFDLKPTHPVTQPCCGATKVDNVIWTEDRETVPEFLKAKGVSLELWQETHDDTVAHFKTYYNCCAQTVWDMSARWRGGAALTARPTQATPSGSTSSSTSLPTASRPASCAASARTSRAAGSTSCASTKAYKECGLKMEIAMEKDSTFESITSCGARDKTVGIRFLSTSHVQTV